MYTYICMFKNKKQQQHCGIFVRFVLGVKAAAYPYVLFLELDFFIDDKIFGKDQVQLEISTAFKILDSNLSDIYYMRSRIKPGKPNWPEIEFRGHEEHHINDVNRLDGYQSKVCYYHYWIQNPVERFPTFFSYCDKNRSRSYCITSRHCSWTNNPFLTSKLFFLKSVDPALDIIRKIPRNNKKRQVYLDYNLVEKWFDVNRSYWLQKDYICAMGEGLFSHLDMKS
jgi:hypothetical protein